MTSTPHNLVVTHVPLDASAARISGSIAGQDVNLTQLSEIIRSTGENLALTERALDKPELRELAQAVRGAILDNQKLAYHLAQMHMGIADGTLNYYDDPVTIYTAE